MTTAMGICELGMINDMRRLDMISHNLANANTAGYKRDIAVVRSFESILSEELGPSSGSPFALQQTDLVPQLRRIIDDSPGALSYTGNPLDMAIEGNGYFELHGPQGVRYSRHGSFSMDAAGRLVDRNGFWVAAAEGEVLLHGGEVSIDHDGKLSEDGVYVGQLKMVRFKETAALAKESGGLWSAPAGVSAKPVEGVDLRQGYIESSNVQALDEMARMMTTLRHFEATSSVMKGYDDMLDTAISTIAEF